ncbi:MAG: DNA polymerase III subunit alpha [Acidobacteriota bacterium]
MQKPFVHLHNHSEYSILDGAIKIDSLVEAAAKYHMPAVAITDHGNIFGTVSFYHKALEKNIKPIIGAEVYIAPSSRFEKKGKEEEVTSYHLILLVKNEKGYKNLVNLLTKSYLEGFYYKPRIDKELLQECSEGLIGLSSCLKGEIPSLLIKDLIPEATRTAGEYKEIFSKENFFLELQYHNLPEQKKINPLLVEIAKNLDIPLVVTNDIHYLKKSDAQSQDVLLCIQTNKKISDQDRLKFGSDEFYFKSTEEMYRLFGDYPDALNNTLTIAGMCDFGFPKKGYFLPKFKTPDLIEEDEYFEKVVKENFEKRISLLKERKKDFNQGAYQERLQYELNLIKKMGFSGYFLIVWDIIQFAKKKKIPVGPGRGSVVSSLVAYALEITDIDPIEYNLLFERFLNPERISMPDIDMDFCGRRRQEIIDYVREKYGKENVAQIITFGTMAARAVVRDVGRVMEVPLAEVDRIAKMIPFGNTSIDEAINSTQELKNKIESDSRFINMIEISKKLEGLVRHTSTHAAGIVIAPKPLTEFMPLYLTNKNEITTQFAMGEVEKIGLLKMDFLGLRNLTIIDDAIKIIEKYYGEKIDIDNIPLDDPQTFSLFCSGNTDGVFQFESIGMKEILKKFKPSNLKDLIALNALHRPGPLMSGIVDDFVNRKNNPSLINYPLPQMEKILEETYGIIVYQEQVMNIANEIAGFTMGDADLLRKAMGKKVPEIMKEQRKNFVEKATKKDVKKELAQKIFDQMEYFAGYGFNKSHSTAYAYLAYKTAYLKAHYPIPFMASLLTNESERGAQDNVVKYINECKEMGIKILPPDINESDYYFTVVKEGIRFGLSAIKNVGEIAVKSILEAREKIGKFKSIRDFINEVDLRIVNRKVLESLIKSGAMDSLNIKRSQLYHSIDKILDLAHRESRKEIFQMKSLFEQSKLSEIETIMNDVRVLKEWDESTLQQYEKETLGFYITGHPLKNYENQIKKLTSVSIQDIFEREEISNEVSIAGVITSLKNKKNKKGEKYVTFILEDLTGRIEVIAFPDVYKEHPHLLQEDKIIWISGRINEEGEIKRMRMSKGLLLDEATQKLAKKIFIKLTVDLMNETNISRIKNIISEYPGDTPLYLNVLYPPYKILFKSNLFPFVDPLPNFVKEIENIVGKNNIEIQY